MKQDVNKTDKDTSGKKHEETCEEKGGRVLTRTVKRTKRMKLREGRSEKRGER